MGGGYDTNPVWSPDGSRICWISMERQGYEADKQRLMVADVTIGEDGSCAVGKVRELSGSFKYNVADPVWDKDSRHIWFNSLAEGIQGIFKADLDGQIERLTSEDWLYDFGSPYHIADGTVYAPYQSMDFPTELVAISADGLTPVTSENADILARLAPHKTEKRFIRTGAPWDSNPTARRHYANSPHKLIHNWHTPLLVIHGGSDFRVPYDQGMAAFNCAQMMGVPSEIIVFPDENHWILKPQNAIYWHRSYFEWLDRWL